MMAQGIFFANAQKGLSSGCRYSAREIETCQRAFGFSLLRSSACGARGTVPQSR